MGRPGFLPLSVHPRRRSLGFVLWGIGDWAKTKRPFVTTTPHLQIPISSDEVVICY